MVKIKFIEFNNNYEIKDINENSLITDILKKYTNSNNKDINQIYFSHNGKYLSFTDKRKITKLGNKEIILFVFCSKKRYSSEKLKDFIISNVSKLLKSNVLYK